jgi:SAM-dependent methyltransferase
MGVSGLDGGMATEYLFDAAWEQERARLAGIERWQDPGTIRCLETIGVQPGWTCLEVGGGGGSIAEWLAARVGSTGRVVATDLDTRFLDAIDASNLEVRTHDIVNDVLEEDAFDLVHTRMLLEHLTARDEILKRLAAAVKPGGWLLVEDLDWLTYVTITPSPEFERVSAALLTVMTGAGYDPEFARRIGPAMQALGFGQLAADGRMPMPSLDDNPAMAMYRLTLAVLRAPMVATGACSDADIDTELERTNDPAYWSFPPVMVAVWGRKP